MLSSKAEGLVDLGREALGFSSRMASITGTYPSYVGGFTSPVAVASSVGTGCSGLSVGNA